MKIEKTLTAWVVTLFATLAAVNLSAATVTTDQPDYPPESTAIITGTGFLAGETVQLQVLNLTNPDDIGDEHEPWTITAGDEGNFTTTWYVTSDEANTTLQLTAAGLTSGNTATVIFTDSANSGNGTMTVSPTSVTAGSTGNSFTFSFSVSGAGANGSFDAGSYATVIVPSGWTAPQTSSSTTAGFVSASASSGATVGSVSVSGSGPWTITIPFTTQNGGGSWTLTYAGGGNKVTVPATTGTATFTTATHNGSGGTPNAISASPTVTIVKANSSISYSGTNFTYNGLGQTPTITSSGSTGAKTTNYLGTGLTSYSSVSAPTNVGTYLVSNTVASDSNYNGATNTQAFTINKAVLTVTADNKNRTYGTANPSFTASYTGFINGQNLGTSGVTGSPALSTTATTNSPVSGSPYTITAAIGTLASANYSFNFINGLLTLSKADQTIIFDPLATRVVGESFNVSATASSGLPVSFAVFSGPATILGNTVTATNTGTVKIDASQPGDSNWNAATVVERPFTVFAANVTLTLTSSLNPAPPSSNVTFTATLSVVSPSTGTPTGTIQFKVNGVASGAPVSLSGLSASTTIAGSAMMHGSNVITAEYAGDGNFSGSTNTLSPNQIINTPPVNGTIPLTTFQNTAFTVSSNTLAKAVRDPDNDPLTITSFQSTSTRGGTISFNGSSFIYMPPDNYTGTNDDNFTYTVKDPFSPNAATITASIIVRSGSAPVPVLQISSLQPGVTNKITGAGRPGVTYTVQRKVDSQDWESIGPVQTLANGVIIYNDVNPPSGAGVVLYRFSK